MSDEALSFTELLLIINAEYYSLWNYRREIFLERLKTRFGFLPTAPAESLLIKVELISKVRWTRFRPCLRRSSSSWLGRFRATQSRTGSGSSGCGSWSTFPPRIGSTRLIFAPRCSTWTFETVFPLSRPFGFRHWVKFCRFLQFIAGTTEG